jgi:hypothetical protein
MAHSGGDHDRNAAWEAASTRYRWHYIASIVIAAASICLLAARD